MKRKLFFWIDKLKISRTERLAVSVLLFMLLGLVAINAIIAPRSPFDKEYYRELDARFRQRTELMNQKQQQLLVRYKPEPTTDVPADTLPPDSTKRTETAQTAASSLININTADAAILQQLGGIGAAYAKRIIEYRVKNGVFKTKEELLKIKGIGPARLEKIKPFITLGDGQVAAAAVASEDPEPAEPLESKPVKAKLSEQGVINVNTANAAALQTLPGVGPAYASRIIEYRQQNGAFTTKDELIKIKGIGKKRLAKIKPFIKLTDQQE